MFQLSNGRNLSINPFPLVVYSAIVPIKRSRLYKWIGCVSLSSHVLAKGMQATVRVYTWLIDTEIELWCQQIQSLQVPTRWYEHTIDFVFNYKAVDAKELYMFCDWRKIVIIENIKGNLHWIKAEQQLMQMQFSPMVGNIRQLSIPCSKASMAIIQI